MLSPPCTITDSTRFVGHAYEQEDRKSDLSCRSSVCVTSRLVAINAHTFQQSPSNRLRYLCHPELGFVQQEQFPTAAKAEVCDTTGYQDLADQGTAGIPNVDTIATSRKYIADCIAFDAVWDLCVCHGKEPTVGQEIRS